MVRTGQIIVVSIVILLLLAGCSSGTETSPATGTSITDTPATDTPAPETTTTPTSAASSTSTSTPKSPQQGTEWTVTITRVIDGDTVEAQFPNGETDTLRLLGVDTPETTLSRVTPDEFEGIPDTTAGRDHLFNWGEKATEYATNNLNGERVQIKVDAEADRRGSFGRLLVYIYHDGDNFNKQLLTEGYARMFDSSFSKRGEFSNAERTAKENNVGLWDFEESTSMSTPTDNNQGSLSVVQIHEDAKGNDHENENDEYIVFENTGSSSMTLTGWTVSDEADHTYNFPDGFTLGSGQRVTLRTGSGTDTGSELYWGSDSAIWNNGGDTIIVKNENGNVILEKSY